MAQERRSSDTAPKCKKDAHHTDSQQLLQHYQNVDPELGNHYRTSLPTQNIFQSG
jgi:uncharacterized protein YecT (DUF1311 family)